MTKADIVNLIKAVEEGNAEAQYNLGLRYSNGEGVKRNYKQSIEWITKAAEQGYADAQNYLGVCYFFGNYVKRDFKQAVIWLAKAAEQGNSDAQCNLGNCYYNGDGIERDYKQAINLYTKAAEQGNTGAQYNLGNCYYKGKGVEYDYKQAENWFTKAAEQDHINAKKRLNDIKIGVEVEKAFEKIWNLPLPPVKLPPVERMGETNLSTPLHIGIPDGIKLLEKHVDEVFVSFSRADIKYLKELEPFLKSLKMYHGIKTWCDQRLKTGDEWKTEIQAHMLAAKVAILMVSQNFLTSDFICNEELPELLQAASDGKIVIMWIPVSHSTVGDARIKSKNGIEICIADYQAVGNTTKPLKSMKRTERDKIYKKLYYDIKDCFPSFLE